MHLEIREKVFAAIVCADSLGAFIDSLSAALPRITQPVRFRYAPPCVAVR